MPPSFPSSEFTQRKYALVIDAGSSGSRMQIYSWKDPKAERAEVDSQRTDRASSQAKGKARETDQDHTRRLRRLPRVERGVKEGEGEWQKKVEPGESSSASMFMSKRGRETKQERPSPLGLTPGTATVRLRRQRQAHTLPHSKEHAHVCSTARDFPLQTRGTG
jgi:hypothetical protein